LAGLLAVVALMFVAPPAMAVVLTFDGAVCHDGSGTPQLCQNGNFLLQSYGDTAEVDVSHRSVVAPGNTAELVPSIKVWGPNWGDLTAASYGGGVPEITLIAAAGYEVSLLALDLAAYAGGSYNAGLSVYSLDYGTTYFSSNAAIPAATHLGLNPETAFVSGLRIQWGPHGGNVGLDNLNFVVRRSAAVPEPLTPWLLVVGLLGIAARRQSFAR
jgi:hypothetical protein